MVRFTKCIVHKTKILVQLTKKVVGTTNITIVRNGLPVWPNSSKCLVKFTNSVAAQTIIFVPVHQKLVISTKICVLPIMFAATRTHNSAEAFLKKLVTVTIWSVTMPIWIVYMTYPESVALTILPVALPAMFLASTVCDLVGLTFLLVGISVMIVVVIYGWLQQQIPESSQQQRPGT